MISFQTMKIVLSWLRDYCSWTWTDEELIEKLTMSGTEVESVSRQGFARDHFVAARVQVRDKHPNADRLSVCQVDDGSGTLRQVVCGAQNYQAGDIVPLALPGAAMPGGFAIKSSKLRGVDSHGMLCSAKELELPGESEGLMHLSAEIKPGTPLKEIFQGETVLEVEVTPNRADLLSYRGLARELSALGAVRKMQAAAGSAPFVSAAPFKIQVTEVQACPRYTARLLENIKVGPSPDWLKARLEAQGLHPVNNVVDVTNYVLFETGQPLHAFDAARIDGNVLQVRRAAAGEKFQALNGREYVLDGQDLVIADARGAVALAGVMGGEHSGVTDGTTRILLESARFKAADVRRTSRRLALISDSSYRFERGVDPLAVDLALQRAVELLQEVAGAKPGPALESAPVAVEEIVVTLREHAVARLLGYEVSLERVMQILGALGCTAADKGWRIPSYRPDLQREVDLIEEIARIEGMDRVQGRVPHGVAPRSKADAVQDAENALRDLLVAWGYYEMSTNSLRSRTESADAVNLLNPLTEDHAALRGSLLETVLPCVRHNLAHGLESVKGFEIGTVYHKDKQRLKESRRLLLVAAGLEQAGHWTGPARDYDYFSLKGVLEALKAKFPELTLSAAYGPVDSALLKAEGIKVPVYAAEIELTTFRSAGPAHYAGLPSYPAVKRDLAFVVARQVRQDDVLQAIRQSGIAELEVVECFDVFADSNDAKLGPDRKSLAYALTYRSRERTLTEKDVSGWQQRIIDAVCRNVGAELRA